jgi:uncharacterized protein with HEPN domain
MSQDRDTATLLDIARAARLILDFKGTLSKEAFLKDMKTQSAVLHQLLIIGEAVKRLSAEFRARPTTIPWALIAGMRNTLIHEYDDVDLDEVWKTATVDIPALLSALETSLPKEED